MGVEAMSGELERRWDDAVETAWRELRQRLADHVAGMDAGDSIVVGLTESYEDGAAPYCQVALGERMVRVEAVSKRPPRGRVPARRVPGGPLDAPGLPPARGRGLVRG
ncbi:TY-Chap domain-containing protein [Nocardioides xinjiangensis]|uniref:TY-Chap domain-containing protein n=1 Tax=Nocardioides xinjiangensis TaxID=2817376 RepID=UPI0035B0D94C